MIPTDVAQHNLEIESNLDSWKKKPLLHWIYRSMHEEIARAINPELDGVVVELGSGIGNIKEVLPQCLRTDLFPNPWLDQTENAYSLSFEDESVSNVILFDVFHHLRYPGSALREIHRVLRPGGRVVIFEPGMGLLGKLVFGLFHHEPLGLNEHIAWVAPDGWRSDDVDYYAAQSNASRIFTLDQVGKTVGEFQVLDIKQYAQLSYVASGGYSKPQLYPDSAYPFMRKLDRVLDRFPRLFATRMLVTLSKPAA